VTLELDLEKSLVKVADRWFPAVGLICPCHLERERCRETGDEHAWQHHLGEVTRRVSSLGYHVGLEVFVPLENGLAVEVVERSSGAGLNLLLVDPWHCTSDEVPADSGWIPQLVTLPSGHWEWTNCDEEWAAEHLLRLSQRPAPARDLVGLACQLVPLSELARLDRVHSQLITTKETA